MASKNNELPLTPELQNEDTNISEEFTVKMQEHEETYRKLTQESIDCSHKCTEVHAVMDLSKLFIECTFKVFSHESNIKK